MHAGPALGGAGPNWEQFRSAQVPSQLAPRSVELGAGPNWEQLVQSANGRPWIIQAHLSRAEEPAKVGTCGRDRRALQQLALNVHVKRSDLT